MDAQARTSQQLLVEEGSPFPLGACLTETGCNFSVYCPDARAVILCLYHSDTEEPSNEILMPAKTGDYWHCHLSSIRENQHYAYRVDRGDGELHSAPADKLLIDPYAKKLNRPIHWNARHYQHDSQFMIPKGVVVDLHPYEQKPVERPEYDAHQRIVYEAHVKGMTQRHPDVPKPMRGKYLGACHPSVLAHLKNLGVTTVQFMPLASFMPEPYITEKGLTNYWGYNPVNFFAPEPRYAQKDALAEVRKMVDAYHEAGLEVIVDVVFNHTAEGGHGGPILSFKGFCPYKAYLLEQSQGGDLVFSNHSGCGNTVHTSQPVMMTLIMDAMRFWYEIIGVDGFRFDLAVCLGRDPQHFTPYSGLLRAIGQDPVLKRAVLLAEPWDIGPGGYQVGAFPPAWLEVNDKFRDTVRAYWRGDKGLTADFATRLMGSRDIFVKGRRHINTSVNNVTYHDGFTLQDLVSYEQRHNLANGEENRDGHGHNLSANYGVEGETTEPRILALRERQKRNLFASLILSQGTPHILGGDELSRTQQGNNNAYCQDNELNWYDWELNKRKQDFLEFCQYVIELRQSSRLLSQLLLEDDHFHLATNVASIHWYKPDGSDKLSADWQAPHNQAFGVEIRGVAGDAGQTEHWFLGFNASDNDVRFNLPHLSPIGGWTLELDTRYCSLSEQPRICIQRVFLQAGRSLAVFRYSEALR
ncbi:glycogen debranching enzyme GlgX [Alteromonas aestuariivivens]|uniref:Glycogen debranching enzyme GlgX n=1 Tax=Alteromonas aestuariivivens TaxID=1938339 RepID=A0A3D8M8Y7_9ALTE|nr:glycogen debranching protein GlgX [Alteromonas aestuariivivens]RDV26148.1 glycogen debranching enzyme GlgX [Alteromonas aestuariivivens]